MRDPDRDRQQERALEHTLGCDCPICQPSAGPFRTPPSSAPRPVYVEHCNPHNAPTIRRYESFEAAAQGVQRATHDDLGRISRLMLGTDPLVTSGLYWFGDDSWGIVTEATFRERALYATAVADAIAAGQEPPE